MATLTYRPSIRVSFESRLRSGRDTMRMIIIQIAVKHTRTVFLRDRRLGQIVDFYERNTESCVSFPFPVDNSLGLSSYQYFRAQFCVWLPGLAPPISSEISQQMFLYLRQVSPARQDLNDGVMVVMARVEIDEPDVEEVHIEGSGDDGGGIPSNFGDNNSIGDEGDDELSSSLLRGLTLSEINGLRQEGFKSSGGGAEEELRCSICLEEFSEGVNITPLSCSHKFHHSCIATWLERQASCPLCRSHITPPCS
nr:probable E3 ubiquitin-protein ligase RHY1A [Ipomoea batatas]